MSKQRLKDMASLPDSLLKTKFMGPTNDDWYDPDTVMNFQKETLRYTGCEKPLFEHEEIRKDNPHRDMMLRLHATGSVYDHDPYHPELFLGDLSRDVRGVENTPRVSEIAEQSRFRQMKYIEGKLQDSPDTRTEGLAGSKRIDQAVNGGFANTATRMSNMFDDSIDAAVRKSNPNPGRTINQVGDNIKEDQKFYQTKSEMIMPSMGYNPISLLTNQIGVNWQVQPDAKFGLSSVSNTYRSKGAVDAAANAVFRMSKHDTVAGESQVPFTTSAVNQAKETIKQDKKNQMSADVTLTSDSRKNEFINRISSQQHLNASNSFGSKAIDRFVSTQNVGEQSIHKQTHLKQFNPNNQVRLGLMEKVKLSNVEVNNVNRAIVPKKDHMKIFKEIKRDAKRNKVGNETFTTRYNLNTKLLSKALTHRAEMFREKNGRNVTVDTHEVGGLYKQSGIHKPEDRVGNVVKSKSKFNNASERQAVTQKGQVGKNTTINVGNYEFDTDPTTDNSFMTKRTGAQRSGYVFNNHETDNEISPMSEVVNTRRYVSTNV